MLNYDNCKQIAIKKAESYNTSIDKAYLINGDYAFDTKEEFIGIFPVVIRKKNGDMFGLWEYLNKSDLTMDDMRAINLETGEEVEVEEK